jgi:hypothetical protein
MLWKIVISDKSNLSGNAVAAMIQDVRAMAGLGSIRVLQFEGAAPAGVPRFCETGEYIDFDDFFGFMYTVTQVDWASFELSREELEIDEENDYAKEAINNVEKGSAIVRCVDNSLFYVYTKDKMVSIGISQKYNTLCCELVESQNVEWPE